MSIPTDSITTDPQRQDLLQAIQTHRGLFVSATDGMDDAQAATRSTVSELTLGGLVKHVTETEEEWARFIVEGAAAFAAADWLESPGERATDDDARLDGFRMAEGETLAGLLARYAEVAARTDALIAEVDLDAGHELPEAPWFPPGSVWSARRVVLHLIAETSQHAGHADIIREAIDGHKSMG